MSQLPVDCLNEIFECLADEKPSLQSCILVNRLWCKLSIKILWRNVWNYSTKNYRTLVAHLPTESKEMLHINGINILTPTFKFPIFNYASFCKVISIEQVYCKIWYLLKNQQSCLSQNLKVSTNITAQEIIKLFLKQVPSLKRLKISKFWQFSSWQTPDTNFIFHPKAKDSLKYLSELHCTSNISPEFFAQLSRISHNIVKLNVTIKNDIPNELAELISSQKRLACSNIGIYNVSTDLIDLFLKKLPDTLTKLNLYGRVDIVSLSSIVNLTNLRVLQLKFAYGEWFKNFEILEYIVFSQLQILKIFSACPKSESLIKFLKNNGKNLKEIYICEDSGYSNNLLNLSISSFCPVLEKLSTGIKNNELDTLEIILDSCRYLKAIKIWCGDSYLKDKEALEAVMKYSKNISEIVLDYQDDVQTRMLPEDLEYIFTRYNSQRSVLLVVNNYFDIMNSLEKNSENMKIIRKYIGLGVIKEFKVIHCGDVESDTYISFYGIL
ncbi:hypothetical protein RclHR1_05940001 [Rhizophagus clarus]|uniref:F-box domain-containing protein n=1 Tax=Rhizophagus clarus TaxID=94130 RepID=A0A2Z6S6R7_9GLOM|nr:hypothetical protein RclHR1_05940001 [Rhizophagus clarus]GES76429.1 hypothetical protein GLOIN_2v1784405 [Rhizophagus clarus]